MANNDDFDDIDVNSTEFFEDLIRALRESVEMSIQLILVRLVKVLCLVLVGAFLFREYPENYTALYGIAFMLVVRTAYHLLKRIVLESRDTVALYRHLVSLEHQRD